MFARCLQCLRSMSYSACCPFSFVRPCRGFSWGSNARQLYIDARWCVRSPVAGQVDRYDFFNDISSEWYELLQSCCHYVTKMLTSSGSTASTSILMVTARHGQFSGDGAVCGTMATPTTATIVNDVPHPLTDLFVAATQHDDLVRHNNNNTAALTTDVDPLTISSTSHRRRSSNKSGPSLLSASLRGSHKDQVGSERKTYKARA